jgi:rare lipoprotein A
VITQFIVSFPSSFTVKNFKAIIFCVFSGVVLVSCSTLNTTYNVTKDTVEATCNTVKFVTKIGVGTLKMSYKIGAFTFNVISAPLEWPMTSDIASIDGLSPKEAVRQGRVKILPMW